MCFHYTNGKVGGILGEDMLLFKKKLKFNICHIY